MRHTGVVSSAGVASDPVVEVTSPPRLPVGGAVGPTVALVLLVISLLAWRDSVFYTGGADPVVLAKALVSVLALALAWVLAPVAALGLLRARTIALVGLYVGVSLVGALAGGNAPASGVLALRLLIVLATMALLVTAHPPAVLVRSVAAAFAGVGLVLAASGLPQLIAGDGSGLNAGRLGGVLIPTSPNQLAMLLAPPALVLGWRIAQGGSRPWHGALLALLIGLTALTGSRTGLLALTLCLVLVLVLASQIGPVTFTVLALSLPAAYAVLVFTTTAGTYFGRGGEESVLTLNSRTTAWRAALEQADGSITTWLGQGLAVKTVPVRALYIDEQVLDSTWASGFVQGGLVGLLLLALWAGGTLVLAVLAILGRSPHATLWLALAAYAVGRSVLENGLLDTYVLFVVMLVPALSLDRPEP